MDLKKNSGFIEMGLFVVCGVAIFLPFITASSSTASANANFFYEVVGKVSVLFAIGGAISAFLKTKNQNKGVEKMPMSCALIIIILCVISAIANMKKADNIMYRSLDIHLSIGFYLIIISMGIEVVLSIISMKGNKTPVVQPAFGQPMGPQPMMNNQQPMNMGQPMPNQGMLTQPMPPQAPMNNMPQNVATQQPLPPQPTGQPMNQPFQQPMNNQPNNNFNNNNYQ